jgi:hypothetical protein
MRFAVSVAAGKGTSLDFHGNHGLLQALAIDYFGAT